MLPQPPAEPGYQLAEGLHTMGVLKRGMGMGGYSRAYLVEDGDRLTLIDTLFRDDAKLIIDYLWSIGRSPSDLTDIVVTHAHRSHLGGLALLRALSDARVSCHESEAAIVEGGASAAAVGWTPIRPLKLFPFRVLSHLHMPKHKPCVVDWTIDERSDLGALEVLHVPGHTPGSLALRWNDALIVADAVLTWPSFGGGWPGFNLDDDLFQTSLQRLVAMRPRIVGPGHGPPITENTAERLSTLVTPPAP